MPAGFLPWSFSAGDDSYRPSRLGEPLGWSIPAEGDDQGGSTWIDGMNMCSNLSNSTYI